MLRRALVVILAYALSGAGFMFMLIGAFPFLGGEFAWFTKLVPLVWVFAWVAHVRMSVAWVRDHTVDRRWPLWGTAAGLISLASPLLLLYGSLPADRVRQLQGVLTMGALVCVFFLPSIVLAIKLVRFHLRTQTEA
ncbi:MAG: hypothetical protein JNK28_06235 [Burkholderiaceae bacterium]|nr:hypothetical protein [Burkholderiaceae bacterium]